MCKLLCNAYLRTHASIHSMESKVEHLDFIHLIERHSEHLHYDMLIYPGHMYPVLLGLYFILYMYHLFVSLISLNLSPRGT